MDCWVCVWSVGYAFSLVLNSVAYLCIVVGILFVVLLLVWLFCNLLDLFVVGSLFCCIGLKVICLLDEMVGC